MELTPNPTIAEIIIRLWFSPCIYVNLNLQTQARKKCNIIFPLVDLVKEPSVLFH